MCQHLISNIFQARWPKIKRRAKPSQSHQMINHALPLKALPVLVLALGCIAGEARADIHVKVSAPTTGGVVIASCVETDKQVDCPDWVQYSFQAGRYVDHYFSSQKFQELDGLYERWCTGKDRFADGTWYLRQYVRHLSKFFSSVPKWEMDLARLQRWQKEAPNSQAALIAEAIYWHAFAFDARGNAYAQGVTADGWKLYNERIAKADMVLRRMESGGKTCAAYYEMKIYTSSALGNHAEARRTFDEGVKRFPQYHHMYMAMASTYEPKWGGSAERFEAFANEAVALAKGFEGRGLYARLYARVDDVNGMPFDPARAIPRWTTLKAGFEDLLLKYPRSFIPGNEYASMACRSNDGDLYRRLRTRIASYPIESLFDVMSVWDCDRLHQWKRQS